MKFLPIKLSAVVLLTFFLSACFTTELIAPEEQSVQVISADIDTTFHKEYKNWYLLGGLLPIYTTQPEEIIKKHQLVEVRVQTEDTISDGVITFFSALILIGLFPQTVVIEGNTVQQIQQNQLQETRVY